jgi:hypothetical protein
MFWDFRSFGRYTVLWHGQRKIRWVILIIFDLLLVLAVMICLPFLLLVLQILL